MNDVEKIDVVSFLTEVEKRPSIWDTRSEEYKDRYKRDSAWFEICHLSLPNFAGQPKSERKLICRKVQQKWRNIRDYHRKYSIKLNRSGCNSAKKFKYIYYDKLEFLTPLLGFNNEVSKKQEDQVPYMTETDAFPTDCNSDDNSDDPFASDSLSIPVQTPEFSGFRPENGKNKAKKSELEEKVCSFFDRFPMPTPLGEDEDKLFLDSLLPTLRNFDTDQKLEFRVEVLRVMQRIRHMKYLESMQSTVMQTDHPGEFSVDKQEI